MEGINIYKLINAWYSFADEKRLAPSHTHLFFHCVNLNNQLAWKQVFGLPTMATAEYLNLSPNTYRKTLNDLHRLNVVKVVKKSKNQMSANQVTLALAYQNLLKLSKSNYVAFVKAQVHQLRTACAIDIQEYNNTIIQLNTIKGKNEELYREVNKLKIENQKLKNDYQAPDPVAKENDTCLSFSEFWELYDKKVGSKTQLEKKYTRLSEKKREKIKMHLPAYKAARPNKKYRLNPSSYINQEGWEHEMIAESTTESTQNVSFEPNKVKHKTYEQGQTTTQKAASALINKKIKR